MGLHVRGSWPAAAVAAIVIAALGFPGHAVVGEVGHDVSWPQCNDRVPAGAFTIVGVTKALPYQMNPCLVPQVRAAKAFGPVQLYVNTANRGPASPYWSKPGRTTPVPCRNVKSNDDAGCAYNYGWDAAADAFKGARSSLAGVLDVRTVTWWLDVEGSRTPGVDGNSWRGSASANAADLQGFMDFLRSAGVREVGIYSTPLQWSDITGGYHRSSAKNLRARWGFRVRYPLEDAPVWFGGVGDVTDGRRRCKVRSFTGGERLFAQFHDGAYDGNVRCAHPDRRRPTASLVTPHAAVTSASTVNVTW